MGVCGQRCVRVLNGQQSDLKTTLTPWAYIDCEFCAWNSRLVHKIFLPCVAQLNSKYKCNCS